jgi:penicillin amidase
VALGLVHAHLRLGQMEIYRRIARARVAYMAGPLATDIDHGLRILDFGRAVPAIEAALPPATRTWLDGYVTGINAYLERTGELPHEFAVLGLDREPWTVTDVLTIGRLAASDVNWLVWWNLLALRDRADWPEIWRRLVENGAGDTAMSEADHDLASLLTAWSRPGSNSLAVAPRLSTTGGALIANDPHLGLMVPNIWTIVGVKSPSYHVVGLTIAGLPIFAIGRNPWIAWGGTNLRALSSELYDVSGLAAESLSERREKIAVRWWFDREVVVRETPYGPILSDAPQLPGTGSPPVALKWMGHRPSDEVTAMLGLSRARNLDQFRRALGGFAVPGQSFVYADATGTIAKLIAARLPRRDGAPPPDLVLDPARREPAWNDPVGPDRLPATIDPPRGFVTSANDRPPDSVAGRIGLFFSPGDRVARMAEMIADRGRVGIDDLAAIQQDVAMASSVALRDAVREAAARYAKDEPLPGKEQTAWDLILAWNGRYEEQSRGALAFEFLRGAFLEAFYEYSFGAQDWAAYAGIDRTQRLITDDIANGRPEQFSAAFRAGLAAAAQALDDYRDWGDVHRMQLAHPLGMMPVLGSRYQFADFPVGGGSESLMKTAHGTVVGRHGVRYGSNARHISDLSDPDANFFVLLGGQDGWLNSSTFLDQVPLWRKGRYVRMPLRPESVRSAFPYRTILRP